jgi:hypothetical protein
MEYTTDDITETVDALLGYARELEKLWLLWKKDELGQFSPDYLVLNQVISNAANLLDWLDSVK